MGAIYITIATLTAFTLSLTVFGLPPASAVTPSFLTLALAQLWHVFNMRATGSNWLHNEVTRNPFVWGALGLCLILIVTPVTTPAAALLGLAALVYFLVRRYRGNAYRRRALKQLQQLQQEYLVDRDASAYLAKTNALLKSVALVAYPRRDVAARSGEQWLSFLNNPLSAAEQFQPGFVTGAYQRVCPQIDMEQIHRSAAIWIKRHEVTR